MTDLSQNVSTAFSVIRKELREEMAKVCIGLGKRAPKEIRSEAFECLYQWLCELAGLPAKTAPHSPCSTLKTFHPNEYVFQTKHLGRDVVIGFYFRVKGNDVQCRMRGGWHAGSIR